MLFRSAAYWKDMFYVGAATPNEIRRENNLSRIKDGDKVFVPVNTQTLDNALSQKSLPNNENNPDLYDKSLVNSKS